MTKATLGLMLAAWSLSATVLAAQDDDEYIRYPKAINFSRDDRLIAVTGSTRDVKGGAVEVSTFGNSAASRVRYFSFSEFARSAQILTGNTKLFVSFVYDRAFRIMDIETGATVCEAALEGHQTGAILAKDESAVLVVTEGRASIYDLATCQVTETASWESPFELRSVVPVSFDTSTGLAAFVTWSWGQGDHKGRVKLHKWNVNATAIEPGIDLDAPYDSATENVAVRPGHDEIWFLVAGYDLYRINGGSGARVAHYNLDSRPRFVQVYGFSFSADGRYVSVGTGWDLIVADAESGALVKQVEHVGCAVLHRDYCSVWDATAAAFPNRSNASVVFAGDGEFGSVQLQ